MKNSSIPSEAVGIYNKALEMSAKGDSESAIREYKKAISIFPGFIEAYNNIGEIYSRMGMSEKAIAIYLEALKIRDNNKILLNIGVEYYNRRDYKQALDYFLNALKRDKSFIEGNFYTGLVYYNMNELEKAEKYFLNVTGIEKKHLRSNYMLSYIYYEWKQYKKVISRLDLIKDIADDRAFISRYYGFCYYYLGDYDRAVNFLTDTLKEMPKYSKYKNYLNGLTYENKVKEIGDVDLAIKKLEKHIMDETPRLAELTKLSMLYIFKGENKKAEDLLLTAKQKLAS